MTTSRLLLAVLLASPCLHADVLVVDGGGGGDFTTLTAAVQAATDGDTILVRDGQYVEPGPVVIDGKVLTIAADWFDPNQSPAGVSIRPGLVVRNLAPGEQVVLQNLRLEGSPSSATQAAQPGLALLDNLSHVRIQACVLVGGSGAHNDNTDGAPGLDVAGSYSTGLTGCVLIGGGGQFSPTLAVKTGDGGSGLRLSGGQVHVSSSQAMGGLGGGNIVGGWADGGHGGDGIEHVSGTMFVVGSGARGGDGGTSHFGGDGGHGLHLGGAGFAWLMAGSWSSGGNGGWSDVGPGGADGQDVLDPSGLVTDHGGTPHGFDVTSPLRERQAGALRLDGDPSDSTLLFASLGWHQIAFPGKQGVLMLNPAALIGPFLFGTGSAVLPFVAPTLPAGLDVLQVHVQAVYAGVDGVVIGPGRVLTLLDSSF